MLLLSLASPCPARVDWRTVSAQRLTRGGGPKSHDIETYTACIAISCSSACMQRFEAKGAVCRKGKGIDRHYSAAMATAHRY